MAIMQSKSTREIGYLIRASYPVIYIVTDEVERLLEELRLLCDSYLNKESKSSNKFQIYKWTCTDRWTCKGKKVPDANAEDVHTPFSDFMMMRDFPPFSIAVMENFHFYLNNNSPELIQAVRDLSRHFAEVNKTVIFANSVQDFPVEIESLIQIVEHDLPGVDDINKVVDVMIESVKEKNLHINLTPERRYSVVEALKGMRLSAIENSLAYSIVTTKDIDQKVLLAEKCKDIRKAGMLEYIPNVESMDLIGGLGALKDWISKWKVVFTEKAKKFNLALPRGVLLLGLPGCGKSEVARASAGVLGLPLIRFNMADIFSKFVGESEQNMKKALKIIDAVSPCVLWIDEIEKGMSGASAMNSTDGGTSPRTFGTFLQWQNDHKTPVFVVATSNNIDSIPPEYLRKGRFDEIFFVGIPNATERAEIFRVQFIRQKLDPADYDVAKLVDASAKFTGAEIGYSISMAKLAAANQDRRPTTEDILKEISQVIPEAKKNKAKMDHIAQRASELAQPASYPEKEQPKEVSIGGHKFRAIQT